MRKVLHILAVIALLVLGCRSVTIHRHDPVIWSPPGRTNEVYAVDGGWDAHYHSYGLFTSFGSLSVTVGTNVVHIALTDLNSDVSTNHAPVIVAGGTAAGEIVEGAIKGLKK